jgi:hypothetical protein
VAATPGFLGTLRTGVGDVSVANTARDGTGTLVTILTGVAAGTRVLRITVISTGDPADSILNLFLHDGTTGHFWDSFDLGNPAAASTTVDAFRVSQRYPNLYLPNASWSLRAAITVAPTAGVMKVFAFGGDL